MTPEGIKKEKDVDRSQSITPQTGRKLDFTIIGLLVIVAGYFIWESRFAGEETGSEPASVAENVSEKPSAAPTTTETTPKNDNSIAVLPFANRSNQDDDQFFTDGIHDDLLTQLAKINGLKVISRTSMMKYRDTDMSIPQIATELGVSTILEGGVQRAGNRVRINAQLIRVETDEHLWAETYDREMTVENIFDIQSEITRHIVTAIRGELSDAESLALAEFPTSNLQAYEAYLQARSINNRPDYAKDKFIDAQIWAEQAVVLDPEFDQAWSMLAYLHGMALWMGYDATPERLAAMRRALDHAVLLAPNSPWTLMAQSEYKYRIESDFAASLAYLQKAHNLLPGNTDVLERMGVTQRRLGLWQESVNSFLEVMELDPGNSATATLAIETLESIRAWDRIESLTGKWVPKFPDGLDLKIMQAMTFLNRDGNLALARSLFDQLATTSSDDYLFYSVQLPQLGRDFEAMVRALNSPEAQSMALNRGWIGWRELSLGIALKGLGRIEEANDEFNKAIELFADWEPSGIPNTDAWDLSYLALAHAELGNQSGAIEAINHAVRLLPESVDAMNGPTIAGFRAQVIGKVGHREEALAELERLLEIPGGPIQWQLYLDPTWDFFRDDPRFVELATPSNLNEVNQ
jgi:TolB-like protein/Flp pilus assembly protein TadD